MSIARKLVVLLVLLAPAIAAGAAANAETAAEASEQPAAETPEQGAASSASSPAELASGVPPNHQRGERVHPDVQALVPDPEVRDAMREYHRTGQAAVIQRSDSVVYPFGESQPEVTCSPLRACGIELEAGEVVTGVALGDGERWIASPLESGDLDEPTLHVIVKPKDYGLATNLVVATTRRTYHLSLVSPPEGDAEAGEAAYHRRVRFYYPQDLVQRWATGRQLREREAERRETATVTELSALSTERLNFDYTLKGERRIPWTPTTVFDDGHHVYIQLPPAARSVDLPALLVEAPGGGMAISNYRVRGEWYVVDGLFRRAELVAGVGRKKQSVEILNNRPPAGGS